MVETNVETANSGIFHHEKQGRRKRLQLTQRAAAPAQLLLLVTGDQRKHMLMLRLKCWWDVKW